MGFDPRMCRGFFGLGLVVNLSLGDYFIKKFACQAKNLGLFRGPLKKVGSPSLSFLEGAPLFIGR